MDRSTRIPTESVVMVGWGQKIAPLKFQPTGIGSCGVRQMDSRCRLTVFAGKIRKEDMAELCRQTSLRHCPGLNMSFLQKAGPRGPVHFTKGPTLECFLFAGVAPKRGEERPGLPKPRVQCKGPAGLAGLH